ncbi:MAG: enolase C-terminal domain-like protein [Anaerolineae bacterium]
MGDGTLIASVKARQIHSERGHPGIEVRVTTRSGATGVAVATAGISVGVHEVQFQYDGGTRWKGKGVLRAVEKVDQVITPAILGLDASNQTLVDDAIIALDPTPMKTNVGGNATAATSAAVLKAGAAALGIPLYQHIGGVNAVRLPVAGTIAMVGSDRYGQGGSESGGKPSYSFLAYGYDTFTDAQYATWEVSNAFAELMHDKFGVSGRGGFLYLPVGAIKHDKEFWEVMAKAIEKAGAADRVGIQVDVAAGTYWEKDKGQFVGLFSAEPKTPDELVEWYQWMAANYPFVVIEDPMDEIDYEGHARVTRALPHVEIVGDDLYTTNPVRVAEGAKVGATDAMLLKVNQIGTISEAFAAVRLCYDNGMGVMPCESRGEGDAIADYTVGLNCGHLRESALGHSGNRFTQIEAELGSRAVFAGRKGLMI